MNRPAVGRAAAATDRWDPARYSRGAGFVAELGAPLIDLLAPRAGERVLDLGCGEGALTARLAALGAEVVGVDASAAQVAAARARGLDARVMDGQALEFEQDFDAVLSNAALHWMPDADAVIAGVWRALRPGGRFVGETGGGHNVAAVATALEAALDRRGLDGRGANPWYFPTVADYRGRLEAAGFVVEAIELFERPTPVPDGIEEWLEIFAQSFLGAVAAAGRGEYLDEVVAALRPGLRRADGVWVIDYVRLRFRALRPSAS